MRAFAPRPEDDFPEFIDTYYQRCRAAAPEIVGNAGKWKPEDLIPGLSDFDTRFLTRDGLKAADWNRISMAVGQVHLDLALERKPWARTLEHLPGVNLTQSELFDPDAFYPEFSQWSFYQAETERLKAAPSYFAGLPWTGADAVYHWKKIALYYDRYSRTIDPPINLGRFESKYPLHSRYLHYLAPPLHSAVCLRDGKTTPGKLDAFRRAREVFPHPEVMDLVLDGIARHYETPEWYDEPRLTELDILLESYLRDVIETLWETTGAPEIAHHPTPAQLRTTVARLPGPPALQRLFENVKFARFMKGRLWFYAHEVEWFDSLPLIRIELARIGSSFLKIPLEIFSEQCLGERLIWPASLIELGQAGFSKEERSVLQKFHDLADPAIPVTAYRKRARQIVDLYADFLEILEKLSGIAADGTPSRMPGSDQPAQPAYAGQSH